MNASGACLDLISFSFSSFPVPMFSFRQLLLGLDLRPGSSLSSDEILIVCLSREMSFAFVFFPLFCAYTRMREEKSGCALADAGAILMLKLRSIRSR